MKGRYCSMYVFRLLLLLCNLYCVLNNLSLHYLYYCVQKRTDGLVNGMDLYITPFWEEKNNKNCRNYLKTIVHVIQLTNSHLESMGLSGFCAYGVLDHHLIM